MSAAPAKVCDLAAGADGSARPAERRSGRGHDAGLTRDRLDQVFQHCADLGIEVEWDDLGEHRRGGYRWQDGTIFLSLRLTAAQATATLAHEIAHHKFGDRCTSPAAERRAWEYGAAFLITPEEYREAEELVGHHVSALAIELAVTPKLISAWQRWWETRGRSLATSQAVKGADSRSGSRD